MIIVVVGCFESGSTPRFNFAFFSQDPGPTFTRPLPVMSLHNEVLFHMVGQDFDVKVITGTGLEVVQARNLSFTSKSSVSSPSVNFVA